MAATCKHKVGLLSLRDCKEPAETKCKICARPVCQKHRKKRRIEEKIHFVCVECYLQAVSEKKDQDEDLGWQHRRRRYYQRSGYRPYYYGHSRRYREDDYDYFDSDFEDDYEDFNHESEYEDAEFDADHELDEEDFQDS